MAVPTLKTRARVIGRNQPSKVQCSECMQLAGGVRQGQRKRCRCHHIRLQRCCTSRPSNVCHQLCAPHNKRTATSPQTRQAIAEGNTVPNTKKAHTARNPLISAATYLLSASTPHNPIASATRDATYTPSNTSPTNSAQHIPFRSGLSEAPGTYTRQRPGRDTCPRRPSRCILGWRSAA